NQKNQIHIMQKYSNARHGSSLLAMMLLAIFSLLTSCQSDPTPSRETHQEYINSSPTRLVNNTNTNNTVAGPSTSTNFVQAAQMALPSVVHIAVSARSNTRGRSEGFDLRNIPDPFRDFFGGRDYMPQNPPGEPLRRGSGSGVILSEDGYIITNNHVVDNAEEVEVTLNDQRQYKAKVVGTDPSTDIALIKIDAPDLQAMPLGNSDEVQVGEWVLAVGNPFNLASTVTAGIVSAKGRNINILKDRMPIESFIQTDAAINPGNSGGALINLNGELIGINTAIATPTGVYAGYAFAVPTQIVNKVMEDLKEYGIVQRGFLGIMIRGINGNFAKEKNISVSEGVYVDSLTANSAAGEAGIRKGDVILAINGNETKTSAALLELVGRQRPGDEITISILRNGMRMEKKVVLKNSAGTTDLVNRDPNTETSAKLGAVFSPVDNNLKKKLGLSSGLQVTQMGPGKLYEETNIRMGFIITKANGKSINSEEDLMEVISKADGGIMIEGRYPNSDRTEYHAFGVS
ncbi:MAG: Do family serine endopeptidase, partial [Bacteroidota bacterium]